MDIVLGLLALIVGAALCFRGYFTMRLVIPIWGAFQGFLIGASLVAANTDDGFLEGLLAWVVGIVLAAVFGYLAYAYFVAAVVLTMATIGFVLGSSLIVALDIDWSWLILLAGVLVGALVGWAALATRLPMVLLTVVTAAGGATMMVGGLLLLFDVVQSADIGQGGVAQEIDASLWWWLLAVGLFVAGIVAQLSAIREREADLYELWEGPRSTSPRPRL